jgi:hypothetical protein
LFPVRVSRHWWETQQRKATTIAEEKGGEKSMADTKQAMQDQKDIEAFLSSLGFEAVEEFEEQGVRFTKYEKLGIGVRIERNL